MAQKEKEGNKVEALKKKRQQLDRRIKKMEALEKLRQKKQDTRRKILIGAYMIDKARKDDSMSKLYQEMDQYLTRNSDRVLFNLKLIDK